MNGDKINEIMKKITTDDFHEVVEYFKTLNMNNQYNLNINEPLVYAGLSKKKLTCIARIAKLMLGGGIVNEQRQQSQQQLREQQQQQQLRQQR